jgi:hypothetical protein
MERFYPYMCVSRQMSIADVRRVYLSIQGDFSPRHLKLTYDDLRKLLLSVINFALMLSNAIALFTGSSPYQEAVTAKQ